MSWSLPVGSVLGVRIRIHGTFGLILAWFGWMGWGVGGASAAAWAVGLIACLFVCVVLHELGHSVVAMRFGAEVRSITLLPIGGVAQMNRIPEKPHQEFLVAVAGPLTNVLLAAGLVLIRGRLPSWSNIPILPRNPAELADALVRANVVLVVFNLIPAFPMDGGRILRSILARMMEHGRATSIAAAIGQLLAVAFIAVGLRHNPFLAVIGFFVLISARGEEQWVRVKKLLGQVVASEIMDREYATLSPGDRIERCLELAHRRGQDDFPVVEAGVLVGLLPRRSWISALHREGSGSLVADVMDRRFIALDPACSLARIQKDLWQSAQTVFPVVDQGRLVGLVGLEDVGRYLVARQTGASEARSGAVAPQGRRSRLAIDLG